MIVLCPACSARFQYPDDRFHGAERKRFRCPTCGRVFEVAKPEPPEPAAEVAPTPAPPALTPAPLAPAPSQPNSPVCSHSLPPGRSYRLAFLTGPLASSVHELAAPITVIGREEGDVVVQDPEISRRHARLAIHVDGSVWLTDLGTTNGTKVAGQFLQGSIELANRQEFTCGQSTFMLLIQPALSASSD